MATARRESWAASSRSATPRSSPSASTTAEKQERVVDLAPELRPRAPRCAETNARSNRSSSSSSVGARRAVGDRHEPRAGVVVVRRDDERRGRGLAQREPPAGAVPEAHVPLERRPDEEGPEPLDPLRLALPHEPRDLALHRVARDELLGEDAPLGEVAAELLDERRDRAGGEEPVHLLAQLREVHVLGDVDRDVEDLVRAGVDGEPVDALAVLAPEEGRPRRRRAGCRRARGARRGRAGTPRRARWSCPRGPAAGGAGAAGATFGSKARTSFQPYSAPVLRVDREPQVRADPVGEPAAEPIELLAGARRDSRGRRAA